MELADKMKRQDKSMLMVVICIFSSLPASARQVTRENARIRHQRELIVQQRRQIQENQLRLQAQRDQIISSSKGPVLTAPARDENRGIFGNVGNCPAGTRYDLFYGCLPAVLLLK